VEGWFRGVAGNSRSCISGILTMGLINRRSAGALLDFIFNVWYNVTIIHQIYLSGGKGNESIGYDASY